MGGWVGREGEKGERGDREKGKGGREGRREGGREGRREGGRAGIISTIHFPSSRLVIPPSLPPSLLSGKTLFGAVRHGFGEEAVYKAGDQVGREGGREGSKL